MENKTKKSLIGTLRHLNHAIILINEIADENIDFSMVVHDCNSHGNKEQCKHLEQLRESRAKKLKILQRYRIHFRDRLNELRDIL